MYCSYIVWCVNTSGTCFSAAARSAVAPSKNGWCEWITSGWKFSNIDDSATGIGRLTEKLLSLKFWMAGTRSTSTSSAGMLSNVGATTSTRWPIRRNASVKVCTERATPPTWGRYVFVIIKIFIGRAPVGGRAGSGS